MNETLSRLKNKILATPREVEALNEFVGSWVRRHRQRGELADMAAELIVASSKSIVQVFRKVAMDHSNLNRGIMIYKLPYRLRDGQQVSFALSFKFDRNNLDRGVTLSAWRDFDDNGRPKDVTEEVKIVYRRGDNIRQVVGKVQDYCEDLRKVIDRAVRRGEIKAVRL